MIRLLCPTVRSDIAPCDACTHELLDVCGTRRPTTTSLPLHSLHPHPHNTQVYRAGLVVQCIVYQLRRQTDSRSSRRGTHSSGSRSIDCKPTTTSTFRAFFSSHSDCFCSCSSLCVQQQRMPSCRRRPVCVVCSRRKSGRPGEHFSYCVAAAGDRDDDVNIIHTVTVCMTVGVATSYIQPKTTNEPQEVCLCVCEQ